MEDCVVTEVIDYAAMARQQATDTGVQRLVAESNLQIARCELPGIDEQLIVDMSTENPVRCSRLPGHAECTILITI